MGGRIQQIIALATIICMVDVIVSHGSSTEMQRLSIAFEVAVAWAVGYLGGRTKQLEDENDVG